MHWIDPKSWQLKKILLHVLYPEPGEGVGRRVANELFYFLKSLGLACTKKLKSLITDNGSDAVAAVDMLIDLINELHGDSALTSDCHVRCFDHTVQLAVKESLKFVKEPYEKLRKAVKLIRQAKVKRHFYRTETRLRKYRRTEPPVIDSKTRWNSQHQFTSDSCEHRLVIDQTMNQWPDDLGTPLVASDWKRVQSVVAFLREPRSVMEEAASDQSVTLSMVLPNVNLLLFHCTTTISAHAKGSFLNLAATAMRDKLNTYVPKLNSLVVRLAMYLDNRIPKPTDSLKITEMKQMVRR